jgi:phosphate acetyltransferase
MNILSSQLTKVGLFRPIIHLGQQKDHDIELVSKLYNLPFHHNEMYGLTSDDALNFLQEGKMDEVFTAIINKYKALESKCDFILVEGTDFKGSLQPFEFDFNAQLANNLSAPVLGVVKGFGKTTNQVVDTVQLIKNVLSKEKCTYLGTVVNRANGSDIDEIKVALGKYNSGNELHFVIPELESLQKLTIRQISNALKMDRIYGADSVLDYDIHNFKVGAMSIEHMLKATDTGTLVITAGDRSDVILALFMSLISDNFPKIAGIVLTCGFQPDEQIMNLINGIKELPIAVYKVDTDTYQTAMNIANIKPVLTADNKRRMATVLGHFETHVDAAMLADKIVITPSSVITPIMFEYQLYERARADRKMIVLPEGNDSRILQAAEILLQRNVVDITILGNEEEIFKKAESLHLKLKGVNIIDPYDNDLMNDYASTYYRLRKDKGITKEQAMEIMHDVSYLGTMMVYKGHADGMVSGAAHTTQHTIRPAFEFIKTKPGFSIVSSSFLMCFEDRVLVYGDCAVNPNPNAEQLADIAISSAETAKMFGIEPRIAMLSYSTGISGKGADVEKVRLATQIARERRPDLKIEGPIQYDAAIDAGVAATKMPDSEVAGKATVFIFPDLNTGNNTYKAVQRSANAVAIGPVSQGLNKPINDLSRGALVKDIVNTVMITAIQAQME